MARPVILLQQWLPDGRQGELAREFPQVNFVDAARPEILDQHLAEADIAYGLPPVGELGKARKLRWIQLGSAGVPQNLGPACLPAKITVTNLAGLYGPTIAEHALAMMLMLSRNLQIVRDQQMAGKWDREVAKTMTDLFGKTLAVIGTGNIGQNIARLARAFGMRVVGCRRTDQPCPQVDQIYPLKNLHAMLGEADYIAVAAPSTVRTDGMLGSPEFKAMKQGVVYINVSRGTIAQEPALLNALQSGHVAAAGLDVFAVEPLAANHPFWKMPNVLVSPHYSGETMNLSAQPSQRFARNLNAWLTGDELEGRVNLEQGY